MTLHEHLQPLPSELLKAMARGEVDVQEVAAKLMAGRGLDERGKWVGFERASAVWLARKESGDATVSSNA
ncbi:hypothetical protein N7333_12320 [Pseudomonas sp. GD04158]|uniref:hypothetical protein n=1 Tax=Pseudomonas sp. GD04158 TaxID=2975439 RepID=UPI0024491EE3|nr:hypothetical protein [Pseudomonas sp. GD04158]MDH0097361.1 hypothetical protein [Pseudomonas sp. GD04158]